MMTQYFASPATKALDELLQKLYQRRNAVDNLIHSLEDYDQSTPLTGTGANPAVNGAALALRSIAS